MFFIAQQYACATKRYTDFVWRRWPIYHVMTLFVRYGFHVTVTYRYIWKQGGSNAVQCLINPVSSPLRGAVFL